MTATLELPPEVAASAAVSDLRRARRRRRLGEQSWGDLAYRAYTTTLATLVAVVFLSGLVGDDRLSPSSVDRLAADGPAWLGLLVAVVVLVAVRSGSRGGPVALEAPDVQHLLLGPAPRRRTMRRPTVGVLGYGALGGALVGGLAGSLVDQRVDGSAAPWVAAGAVFVATTMALALSCGVLTASRLVPRWVALGAAWLLLAWAVADVAATGTPPAPTTFVGRIAVWPLDVDPSSVVPVLLALVLPLAALSVVGGISVEAARRRTALVGQLRFAVTQQDLRTVVLLRRQLASERPRKRPWFGGLPRPLAVRWPVLARDLRSVARWPITRIARVVVLGAGIGLALRGMFGGTTPLVLVAGILAYVAGLDATEPLAQDIDHPGLLQSSPAIDGDVLVRHLVQPVLVMVVVGLVAVGTAWAVDPQPLVLRLGLVMLVPAALAAVGGAAVTVVSDNSLAGDDALVTPEVAGPRLLFRTVWPPLVAVIGMVPALAAHAADRNGSDPLPAALTGCIPVVLVGLAVVGWVRFREDIHRSIAEATGGSSR